MTCFGETKSAAEYDISQAMRHEIHFARLVRIRHKIDEMLRVLRDIGGSTGILICNDFRIGPRSVQVACHGGHAPCIPSQAMQQDD
jgi:hypothetical protein